MLDGAFSFRGRNRAGTILPISWKEARSWGKSSVWEGQHEQVLRRHALTYTIAAKEIRFMNSGMIGKIDKAHRYAQEPERIRIGALTAEFEGSHDHYDVSLTEHGWHCSCHTFEAHVLDSCPHIMAAQQILAPMLSEEARFGQIDTAVAV
jgi:hypothetical protein